MVERRRSDEIYLAVVDTLKNGDLSKRYFSSYSPLIFDWDVLDPTIEGLAKGIKSFLFLGGPHESLGKPNEERSFMNDPNNSAYGIKVEKYGETTLLRPFTQSELELLAKELSKP